MCAFVDDTTSRDDSDVKEFSRRFYEGTTQKSTLLNVFAENLRGMFKYYDPIIASAIIQSTLAFVDACLLEVRRGYQMMPQAEGGEGWSHYIRVKDGLGDAFAFFLFPRAIFPEASSYLQVIPDFVVFLIRGNDLFS